MPIVCIGGAQLNYEIKGDRGKWVVLIPGGRHPLSGMAGLAQTFVDSGKRVLLFDQRNCGQSSVNLNSDQPEETQLAKDLYALMHMLDIRAPFIVGKSRGARIAIQFALKHPNNVACLGLWGLNGGAAAALHFQNYYYAKYIRACQTGGMQAVCALDHFAQFCAFSQSNRATLLGMDPAAFLRQMHFWDSTFLTGGTDPVLGFTLETLAELRMPVALVPFYDRLHPMTATMAAHSAIAGSALYDFDPAKRENDEAMVASIFCGFADSPGKAKPPTRAKVFLNYLTRVIAA